MSQFLDAKNQFDQTLGRSDILSMPFVTVNGKTVVDIRICNNKGQPVEEYYKWQFLYGLIYSGLYAKDYIGAEIRFPKGNKTSAPLQVDAAIFDDPAWIDHYIAYWRTYQTSDLEWLNQHLIAAIEFKKGDKEIEKVISGQVKPAVNQKDPGSAYVLGIYYDTERLYLFHRLNGKFLRYNSARNAKGDASGVSDMSLHLPDAYQFIPSFKQLNDKVNVPASFDRSKRGIGDLDTISELASQQMQDALSNVLRALDRVGLANERGYRIFIETLATKIFDEKRNQENPKRNLDFYITDDEAEFNNLTDASVRSFVNRLQAVHEEAKSHYKKILGTKTLDWKTQSHVRAVVAICQAFQDYSFLNSATGDLYQIVFYNFASEFSRSESAQFLTPLPVIQFLVSLVNPRDGESVIDPCCSIGDFLSLSYVHSLQKEEAWHLKDANIYGVDRDDSMIMLATLNMLLNGDGEAKLFHQPDKGSILFKPEEGNFQELLQLLPEDNKNGEWDNRPDDKRLKKFDVVLTNPPFG